jgi:predicted phosphodiesterase
LITRKLSRHEVPDGSVIAVLSDVHIPGHDEDACKLAVECCEAAGATHVILNGDIADCGPASRHEGKKKRAVLDEGCLRESVAAGLWLYEWARTRPCYYVLGNHEAWVSNYIENTPELKGTRTTELMGLWKDGDGWEVLPQYSRVRIGNMNWEHGDGFFKAGNGGDSPGLRIKRMAPDQTTHIGHLHRNFALFWSTPDENGVMRTRAARGNGHMSLPEYHEEYAGTYINWQQSFELTRVYYVDGRARFTTDQVLIHRDRYGRPCFEYQGKFYR